MNSPIFWEKLGEFDKILNNQAPLLRKKAEKIFNTGGIRQRDRFNARGQGVGVCLGKKAVEWKRFIASKRDTHHWIQN